MHIICYSLNKTTLKGSHKEPVQRELEPRPRLGKETNVYSETRAIESSLRKSHNVCLFGTSH
jgi:hypothetical protein